MDMNLDYLDGSSYLTRPIHVRTDEYDQLIYDSTFDKERPGARFSLCVYVKQYKLETPDIFKLIDSIRNALDNLNIGYKKSTWNVQGLTKEGKGKEPVLSFRISNGWDDTNKLDLNHYYEIAQKITLAVYNTCNAYNVLQGKEGVEIPR